MTEPKREIKKQCSTCYYHRIVRRSKPGSWFFCFNLDSDCYGYLNYYKPGPYVCDEWRDRDDG